MPDIVNRKTGVVEFTEAQVYEVESLKEQISKEMTEFFLNAAKPGNKMGAKRARKNTLTLSKLFKTYREISIK